MFFRLINSVFVKELNSKIFLVFNVTLVKYRDLSLQNANKMTSIQDSFIIQLLIFTFKKFFYESIDYLQFIFSIFQINYP